MDIRLDGKVAVVTGASRGIGRAIAEELAASGARVLLCSRNRQPLEEVAHGIAARGGVALVEVAHAANPDDAERAVACAVRELGGCHILINNAATNPYLGPVLEIQTAQYDKTWDVNFKGPLLWTRAAHAQWMAEHGGAVLNLSSIGGLAPAAMIGMYNATKAALINLTQTLAMELGPRVRVNALAPGLVRTEMARALWQHHEQRIAKTFPLGRIGEPADIAGAAVFLVSDAASWITGHTLVVDGGALVRGLSG